MDAKGQAAEVGSPIPEIRSSLASDYQSSLFELRLGTADF